MKARTHFGKLATLPVAWLTFACGHPIEASLEIPEPREARIGLVAALDLDGVDAALSGRISVDEIEVSVEVLRLLGDHPNIPAGGHPLIDASRVLSTRNGEASFPFPEGFLGADLAVFGRISPTSTLDGASVVIRGRLAGPASRETRGLTTREDPREPGPDGEPAKDPCDPGPDGEPAKDRERRNLGQDPRDPGPDGEPARPSPCLRHALRATPSIPFELRGADEVDLVIELGETSRLQVVLGIPAARWLTSDLPDLAPASTTAAPGTEGRVVVDVSEPDELDSIGGRLPNELADLRGYQLIDEREFDPNRYRY
ncbi:MAG: hypothetical protein HYV07_02460 [Deltaproteobacteria bacterium]|nr:hypothetical protein [Deltaproteobacteria bacterium]